MTEEVKQVEGEVVAPKKEVQQEAQQPQYTPEEERALAKGWKPEKEWEGDPGQWRDAKTFLDRGELLDKISSQSREIKQVTAIVNQLSEQNRQVYKAGYVKALNDLRGAKVKALENADHAAVMKIDDAIDQTKETIRQIDAQRPSAQSGQVSETPAFSNFRRQNAWYEESVAMKHWAHGMALEYANANPNASEEDVYRFIEREVKKEFPQKFVRRGPPSPDGESRRESSAGKGNTGTTFEALLRSMPEDQARVARDMVKREIITKEKYVADYEAIGR